MKIINLTPHALNFINDANESVVTVPPSGTVARCSTERAYTSEVILNDGEIRIPVYNTKFGPVEGLPDYQPGEGIVYVVSAIVAQAVPERRDVFIPDDLVRDDQGRIVGAKALAHV